MRCAEQNHAYPYTSEHLWNADHHNLPAGPCVRCGEEYQAYMERIHGTTLEFIAGLQQQITELQADLEKQAVSAQGLPCANCGMVWPGKPSAEPWACDKCLEESSLESKLQTANGIIGEFSNTPAGAMVRELEKQLAEAKREPKKPKAKERDYPQRRKHTK